MTGAAFVVSVVLGSGSLAFAFAQAGFLQVARWLLFLGAAWLLAEWRRWTWFSSLGFLALLVLAAFGLWIELPPPWIFAGALGGMFAWDLSNFMLRLRLALAKGLPGQYEELKSLERPHLARLAGVALTGGLVAGLFMLVHLAFSFAWVVLLAFLMAFGMAGVIIWLRTRR